MLTTEITKPKEGSNKNEFFNDRLSVGNMPALFYYEEFEPWIRAKRVSPVIRDVYMKS